MARVILLSTAMPMVTKLTRYYHVEALRALLIQEHADIIGCRPIIRPRESEPVLLGAAILGAVAGRKYSSLHEAMKALNAVGQVLMVNFLDFSFSKLIFFYLSEGEYLGLKRD